MADPTNETPHEVVFVEGRRGIPFGGTSHQICGFPSREEAEKTAARLRGALKKYSAGAAGAVDVRVTPE